MARSRVTFVGSFLFLAGIGAASIGLNINILGLILAAFGLAWYIRHHNLRFTLIFAFLLFAGFWFFHLNLAWRENSRILPNPGSVLGVVVSESTFGERAQFFELKLSPPGNGHVKAVTHLRQEIKYGDLLHMSGRWESASEKFQPPVLVAWEWQRLASGQGNWLFQRLFYFKFKVLNIFRRILPPEEAGLAGGLLLGARSTLSPQMREALRQSGTTHLIAISGYNIGLLIWLFGRNARRIFGRKSSFVLLTALLFAFVLLTGSSASVVRAAIMGFLALLANQIGRRYNMERAVLFTALGMTLWDPTILRFDLGFQLSFLSLLGIAYLEPILNPRPISGIRGVLKENFSTTAAAQLAVLPVLLLVFDFFSPISLLANLLILFSVPFAMALAAGTALLGLIFLPLGALLAWPTLLILKYQVMIISVTGSFALGWHWQPGLWPVIFYYLILTWFIIRHRQISPRYALPA